MDLLKVGSVVGPAWNLEGREQVAGIYVYYNRDTVVALQFLFYENGNLVKSDKYGASNAETASITETASIAALVFDYPSEFLTSISGSLGGGYTSVLKTIKIGTNKGSYGPFGSPPAPINYERDFNFHIGRRNLFGGFHGTSNLSGIESIGVYVKMSIPSSSITNYKDLQIKDEDSWSTTATKTIDPFRRRCVWSRLFGWRWSSGGGVVVVLYGCIILYVGIQYCIWMHNII